MTNPRRRNRKQETSSETPTIDTQTSSEQNDSLNETDYETFGLPTPKKWTHTPRRRNDIYGVISVIIDAAMNIISLIVFIPAKILENFMGKNKPGTRILAALMFIAGVIQRIPGL